MSGKLLPYRKHMFTPQHMYWASWREAICKPLGEPRGIKKPAGAKEDMPLSPLRRFSRDAREHGFTPVDTDAG